MAEASTSSAAAAAAGDKPPEYEAIDYNKPAGAFEKAPLNNYPTGPPAPGQPGPSGYPYPPAQYPVQGQYPGPPPGVAVIQQPQPAVPANVVGVTVTGVQYTTIPVSFNRYPVQMTCPHCQDNILTVTHTEPGGLTWLITLTLIILCCWMFAWLPFVDRSTHDVTHTCPSCGVVVGTFKRM